jgi:Flp pilus assembly protein TadD
MRNTYAVVLLALSVLAPAGCHTGDVQTPSRYDTLPDQPHRDTETARKLSAEALDLIAAGELDRAEEKLKAALEADLFFGPAHNNLGTVYYRQEQYYRAAWEYQYAAKLMPHQAEPRNNLGMVYEAVGRLDEAAGSYAEALELEPEAVEITANLARVYVRQNRKDAETRKLLEDVVLKDDRPQWVSWARERLATMGTETQREQTFSGGENP